MKQTEVTDWLYNECITVLSNSSAVSVSTPASHVDLADDRDEQTYPFVALRPLATSKESAGIGNGDLFVDDMKYTNGVVDSVIYKKEPTLRIEIAPLTDGDAKAQTDLGDEIADHFDVLARTKTYPSDIDEVRVEEASPQNRPEEFVYADGIALEVDYDHYIEQSVEAAETVNVDVDTSQTVDDDSDDSDAFDRSL